MARVHDVVSPDTQPTDHQRDIRQTWRCGELVWRNPSPGLSRRVWAVGLRTRNASENEIEQAIANRSIVRTWPMRGTLHFVAADDVRWMLALLTPRVIAGSASRWKQLELDEATFARSRKTIVRALQGGKQLEREEMYQVLESARISTAGQRGIHILGRLAQEGAICFGARAGKQHTFVLLDEWVPNSKRMERDAALAELAQRYFTSHGPATLQDFVWWSGLATYVKQTNAGGGMLNPTIVVNGQVVGTWKRNLQKDTVVIAPSWFTTPKKSDHNALESAAQQYRSFLRLSSVLVL